MPDWLAHVLFAYVLCRVFGFKFKEFDNENTAVVMVGSLMPDLVKIGLLFELLSMDVWPFIISIHTPIGTLLTVSLFSLLFLDSITVFLFLAFGATIHFFLDFLMKFVIGGIPLFFPFSWKGFQLGLIPRDNYTIALILVLITVVISKMPIGKEL